MRNKNNIVATDLVCLNCGNVSTIQRKIGRTKCVGHIKNLYCDKCRDVQSFYEVRDVSIFIWECMNTDIKNLNDVERVVFNFLMKREDNYGEERNTVYKKIFTRRKMG